MTLFFCITILFALFAHGLAEIWYTSTKDTTSGMVQGQYLRTVRRSVRYEAYTGIPFAEPPVDNLRFKAPVEKKKSPTILNSTTDGNPCLQPDPISNSIVGSEDCLYLSVYVPEIEQEFSDPKKLPALKPVMFWIHGGSFTVSRLRASSSFRPDFLLEEGVIVVSTNYRLGPLGFLNLHHEDAPGNAGLKDQLLALKWTQKNIETFGGDPNKVTIFGQSAGGVSVDYHVLSELSAGLFHRAISMSGSPLNLFWGLQMREEAESNAKELGSAISYQFKYPAEIVNIPSEKDRLLQYLRGAPAKSLIALTTMKLPTMPFRVTLETKFNNQDAFVTECSLSKYLSGKYNKVPYLMGFTSNEAKSFYAGQDTNMSTLLKGNLGLLRFGRVPLKFPLFKKYIANKSSLTPQDYEELVETTSDVAFVAGIDSKQQFMELNNENPVYYYKFSFDRDSFFDPSGSQLIKGVGHEEDLSYLFHIPDYNITIDQPDIAITITRYVRFMTNFAHYGHPTPPGIVDRDLNITWPNSGVEGLHLDINRKLSVGPRPVSRRVKQFEMATVGNSPILNECNTV